MVPAADHREAPMKQQPKPIPLSSVRDGRIAALPLLLRDLGDDLLDLDNGAQDRDLLYLAAQHIEHLESVLTSASIALGCCT